MFESLLSNFLSTRLTQFVKHIDTEKLKVGIWNGEVALEDLELRTDCLEGLGGSLFLQAGYVGNLKIKIPWNAFTSKPVVIELERIHLILHAQEHGSRKSDDAYAELAKQASIAAAELAKRANLPATPSWKSSLFSRFLTRIINSIQLKIRDVHVRIEIGRVATGCTPFVIGTMVEEISSSTGKDSDKMLHGKGVAVYWDREVEPTFCGEMSLQDLASRFSDWGANICNSSDSSSAHEDDDGDIFYIAPSEDEFSMHQYLIYPFDLTLNLRIISPSAGNVLESEKAKYDASLTLKSMRLSLEVGQFWDMLRLADWVDVANLRKENEKIRPESRITDNPGAWWRYAIVAVMRQCKRESARLSWAEIQGVCSNRQEYSLLYRRLLAGKASSSEQLKLTLLESQLPVEQIMLSRAIAEELSGNGQEHANRTESGWFRWGLRWAASPEGATKGDVEEMEVEFTQEEKEFLSSALDIPAASVLEDPLNTEPPVFADEAGRVSIPPMIADSSQNPQESSIAPSLTRTMKRNKCNRPASIFYGLPFDKARELAVAWFDPARIPNTLVALTTLSLDELSLTMTVRMLDDENCEKDFYNVQEIVTASLSTIKLNVRVGTEEVGVNMSVTRISVRDMLTQQSSFPWLLSSKLSPILQGPLTSSKPAKVDVSEIESAPAFVGEFQIREGIAVIRLKLLPVELVALPECLFALAAFFVPEYEAPFHENQIIASLNQIEDGPGRIRAKLAFLVKSMGAQISFELQAESPRIVIPADVSWPDRAIILSTDSVTVQILPYSCHGYTPRAISSAALIAATCTSTTERRKLMQEMFYGNIHVVVHSVRLFLAEQVPIVESSFVSQRLANALRARLDSKGIFQPKVSTPQYAKSSQDLLLPMDVDCSTLASLLRSDASMPLLYIRVSVSSLQLAASTGELELALDLVERMGQVHPQYLELRRKIEEQAQHANIGSSKSFSSHTYHRLPSSDRRSGHGSDVGTGATCQQSTETSSEMPLDYEKQFFGETSDSAKNDAIPRSCIPMDKKSTLKQDLVSGFPDSANQVRMAEQPQASSQPESRWKIMQWLKPGNVIGSSGHELVEAAAGAISPHSSVTTNLESAQQNTLGGSEEIMKPKKEATSVALSGLGGNVRTLFGWGKGSDGGVGQLDSEASDPKRDDSKAVDNLANRDSNASALTDASRGVGRFERGWFRWKSQDESNDKDSAAKTIKQNEHILPLTFEKKTSGLLSRFKFLYPAGNDMEHSVEKANEEEEERSSFRKVMQLPSSTRYNAFLKVEKNGRHWKHLDWDEKLMVCLQVDGLSSRANVVGDRPNKLRRQHSSSFMAANLEEISPLDAVHMEMEVSVLLASLKICSDNCVLDSPDPGPKAECPTFCVEILPRVVVDLSPHSEDSLAALFANIVLRRHGVDLKTSIGDLMAPYGFKIGSEVPNYMISTIPFGPQSVLDHDLIPNDVAANLKANKLCPFLDLSMSYFEDGHAPKDAATLNLCIRVQSFGANFSQNQMLSMYELALFLMKLDKNRESDGRKGEDSRMGSSLEPSKITSTFKAKISFELALMSVAVQDQQLFWNKASLGSVKTGLDSREGQEKLGEIIIGHFGIAVRSNDERTWGSVLTPERNHNPDASDNAFELYLDRKDCVSVNTAAYKIRARALDYQKLVRGARNLVQDQKMTIRTQLQDRKIDFRTQKRCVTGSALTSFLVDGGHVNDRDGAIQVGQFLIDQGLMHKVSDNGEFEDCNAFYRFFADEHEIGQGFGGSLSRDRAANQDQGVKGNGPQPMHYFLTAKIKTLNIELASSICEAVSHLSRLIDHVGPQSSTTSPPISSDSDWDDCLLQTVSTVLQNSDVNFSSGGLSFHCPNFVGETGIIASCKRISLISSFQNLEQDEFQRKECNSSRVGLESSRHITSTATLDTTSWFGAISHRFRFDLSDCMVALRNGRTENVIDGLSLRIDLTARPHCSITLDCCIFPELSFCLSESAFVLLLQELVPKSKATSASAARGDGADSAKESNCSQALKSFFSGNYGLKLECGGFNVKLFHTKSMQDGIDIHVKPIGLSCQLLFVDSLMLPIDISTDPLLSKNPAPSGSLLCSLLDNLALVDLGINIDDISIEMAGQVLLCGHPASHSVPVCWPARASPDELRTEPERLCGPAAQRDAGTGDDWRLVQCWCTWRRSHSPDGHAAAFPWRHGLDSSDSGGDYSGSLRRGFSVAEVAVECRVCGIFARHDPASMSAANRRLEWLLAASSQTIDTCSSNPEPQRIQPRLNDGNRRNKDKEWAEGPRSHHRVDGSVSEKTSRVPGWELPARSNQGWELSDRSLAGRFELRLVVGDCILVCGPQKLCGSRPHSLCLTTRAKLHTLADVLAPVNIQKLKATLDLGLDLAWCNCSSAAAPGSPGFARECAHKLLDVPKIVLMAQLGEPNEGRAWRWRDSGNRRPRLDVECVIAPTVQVQGSFADLEGLHALLDALSGPAATPGASSEPSTSDALQRDSLSNPLKPLDSAQALHGAPAAARRLIAGSRPRGAQLSAADERAAAAKVDNKLQLFSSIFGSFTLKAAGIQCVIAECRRGGPAGAGLLRLPLLDLNLLSVSVRMEALEDSITFSVRGHASCEYLNRGLGAWEPLLERWGCELRIRTDVGLGGMVAGECGRVEADVWSEEHLNINVSCAMFDVVMGVLAKDAKRWLSDLHGRQLLELPMLDQESKDSKSEGDEDAFHPLWISNETGQPLLLECPVGDELPAADTRGRAGCSEGGWAWQVVEQGTHPVTCVPVASASATGLPQVPAKRLLVSLADASQNYTQRTSAPLPAQLDSAKNTLIPSSQSPSPTQLPARSGWSARCSSCGCPIDLEKQGRQVRRGLSRAFRASRTVHAHRWLNSEGVEGEGRVE